MRMPFSRVAELRPACLDFDSFDNCSFSVLSWSVHIVPITTADTMLDKVDLRYVSANSGLKKTYICFKTYIYNYTFRANAVQYTKY